MHHLQKNTLLIGFIISGVVSGCGLAGQSRRADEAAAARLDSIANAEALEPDTVCFRQVTGRDTTMLRLTMKGQAVAGTLTLHPYEKDRATGTLSGIRTGNQITAEWQRSGEGVTQQHELTFVMTNDTVRWREGERVEQAGKWVLKTPNQGFQYVVTKIDCPGVAQ